MLKAVHWWHAVETEESAVGTNRRFLLRSYVTRRIPPYDLARQRPDLVGRRALPLDRARASQTAEVAAVLSSSGLTLSTVRAVAHNARRDQGRGPCM
jgi:hypothetical protein